MWHGTLVRVALSSIQDPSDASMIVRYILVIPTPGMLCRTSVWTVLLTRVTMQGTRVQEIQEFRSTEVPDVW